MEDRKGNLNIVVVLSLLFVQVLSLSSPAQALIYWTNKDGTANGFDWSNGGSDHGLFGNPMLIGGNTFTFFPSNFRAQSTNGAADIKADRVEVCLSAHTGYVITGLHITEYGDYGILTQGMVSVSGTMFLTNLDAFDVRYDSFSSTPASPISQGQGTWSAQVGVDNIEWTNFKVVLDNNLMAISNPGSTTFIQKKVVGEAVAIELICEPIPEPTTIMLLTIGTAALFGKKKRRYSKS